MFKKKIMGALFAAFYGMDALAADHPLGSYGGAEGQEVFRQVSAECVNSLTEKIRNGGTFEEITQQAFASRGFIARKTKTNAAAQFGVSRLVNPNQSDATPLQKYPKMKAAVQKLFNDHQLMDWIEHDATTRTRVIVGNQEEMLERYVRADMEANKKKEDMSMLYVFLWKTELDNGKLNPYYLKALPLSKNENGSVSIPKDAILVSSILDKSCYVAFLEVQTRDAGGVWHPTRSFMSPLLTEDINKAVPFNGYQPVLIHPAFGLEEGTGSFKFHLKRCEELFNLARLHVEKNQSIDDIDFAIGQFAYCWSLTMPAKRGSAACGEWIVKALYLAYGIVLDDSTNKFSIDQHAQISLTVEEFMKSYKPLIKKHREKAQMKIFVMVQTLMNIYLRAGKNIEICLTEDQIFEGVSKEEKKSIMKAAGNFITEQFDSIDKL
jgi:hypothetical protein